MKTGKNLLVLAASMTFACAQDPGAGGGWRRVGDAPPASQNAPVAQAPAPESAPLPQNAPPAPPPSYNLPSTLTLRAGTFILVRTNQVLSSDHNQPGDTFTATLEQPVVVDGIVIAERGQTVVGRVAQAEKAHHGENVSKLGIELTDLTIVDGTQIPIQSELITRTGPGWNGQDTGTVVGTSGVGAVIGAIAGGGPGAAIGAGVGAVAGAIGVMSTHGHPTIVTPESQLTFRITQPVTVSTDRAPQSFRQVQPGEYARSAQPTLRRRPPAPPYAPPLYYGYAYPYPYYGYPYPYWGPYYGGVVIGVGGHYHR